MEYENYSQELLWLVNMFSKLIKEYEIFHGKLLGSYFSEMKSGPIMDYHVFAHL